MTEPAPHRRLRLPDPSSPIPTYVGIVVLLVGFGLIGIAWAEVAGRTDVALQLPYLVSGGITGLGLVMVGVLVIALAAKRQDAAERDRQMERLIEIMRDLRDGPAGDEDSHA